MTAVMLSDGQWMWGQESVWKTPVTVDAAMEVDVSSKPVWDPQPYQGKGLRTANEFARKSRRSLGLGQGSPTVKFDVPNAGFKDLFANMTGAGALTLVSDTTYQWMSSAASQVGPLFPFITMQYGVVRNDGTVKPFTFGSCTCTEWALGCEGDANSVVTCESTWDAYSMSTSTSLAAPTYTPFDPFHLHNGTVYLGETITPPTTTALASGGTSVATIQSWKLTCNNNLKLDGNVVGGRNQPKCQGREVGIELDILYDDDTIVDAFYAGTPLGVTITHQTINALSTGYETLQVCCPSFYIDADALPAPSNGEVQSISVKGTCVIDDDSTDLQPWYVAIRTAEAT